MQRSFEVQNVKCGGCASTLKNDLEKDFGEIEVDLSVEPRVIVANIEEDQVEEFRARLKKLGYPVTDEVLGRFEKMKTTAKSYVSCAIGKMN